MWGQLDQLWQLQSHARHQEENNDMKNMTNRQAMKNNFHLLMDILWIYQ
jgi:hypothetical protein